MTNISLVIFTLLVQASVGLTCIGALWSFKNTGSREISKKEYQVTLLAFILGFGGMIASFTHLGNPINSFNALKNISSSWMSREILLMMIYLFSLAVIISIRFGILTKHLTIIFRNLVFISALLLLYSMIRVYTLPSLSELDITSVLVSFLSTTVFAGTGSLVLINIRDHEGSGNQLLLAGLALSIAFLGFIANPNIDTRGSIAFTIGITGYILSLIVLIPALIPKLKNIYTISAVIFIILGLISEFFNRFILLSLTSFSI